MYTIHCDGISPITLYYPKPHHYYHFYSTSPPLLLCNFVQNFCRISLASLWSLLLWQWHIQNQLSCIPTSRFKDFFFDAVKYLPKIHFFETWWYWHPSMHILESSRKILIHIQSQESHWSSKYRTPLEDKISLLFFLPDCLNVLLGNSCNQEVWNKETILKLYFFFSIIPENSKNSFHYSPHKFFFCLVFFHELFIP